MFSKPFMQETLLRQVPVCTGYCDVQFVGTRQEPDAYVMQQRGTSHSEKVGS